MFGIGMTVSLCYAGTGEVVGLTRASPKRESFVGLLQSTDSDSLFLHPLDTRLPKKMVVHPADLPVAESADLLAEAKMKGLAARTLVCSSILGWDRTSDRPAAKVDIEALRGSHPC